jgi:hypothetical protein
MSVTFVESVSRSQRTSLLSQREPMSHIPRANDEIKLAREALFKPALVICNHNIVGTKLLDVLRLMRGGGESVDLGAEGIGEEDGVRTL